MVGGIDMKDKLTFLLMRIKCSLRGHHYKHITGGYFLYTNCGKVKMDKRFRYI